MLYSYNNIIQQSLHGFISVPVGVETIPENSGHRVGSLTGCRHHHGHDQADDRSPRVAGASHERRRRQPSAGSDNVLFGARRTPTVHDVRRPVRVQSRNEVMQSTNSRETDRNEPRRRFFVNILVVPI